LTGILVFCLRDPAVRADFPKGCIADLTIQRPIRISGDGGGVQVIGQDTIQRILVALDGAHCDRLAAEALEFLGFGNTAGYLLIIITRGVIGDGFSPILGRHVALDLVAVAVRIVKNTLSRNPWGCVQPVDSTTLFSEVYFLQSRIQSRHPVLINC
jgi:hypothetical protein